MSFMPTVMRASTPERTIKIIKKNLNYNNNIVRKNQLGIHFFNMTVIMQSQNLRSFFIKLG